MLQYEGALLGDKRLLEMTNCTNYEGLGDPWKLEGVPRNAVKKRFTPNLYGSQKSAKELLKKAGFSKEDIAKYVPIIAKEEQDGAFGLASLFKDFIINNCRPKAAMNVTIWNETFQVEANRYKFIGEYSKFYKVYDSFSKRERIFKNTHTKKVPDLEQFRRYFVTLLIHNLDSQVANYVAEKLFKKYGWVVPIHDAFIIPPQAVADCRKWYAEQLEAIYRDRDSILRNYFKSIGITGTSYKQWEELQTKIVPLVKEFTCSSMALK